MQDIVYEKVINSFANQENISLRNTASSFRYLLLKSKNRDKNDYFAGY